MPYISNVNDRRDEFDIILNNLPELANKGELEYVIFKMMRIYMKKREFRYSILHDVAYAAIHCGDEFRRRFLDIRENDAREKNGDVE